jgi:putative FmdB family regulatory protein
MPTYVYRCKKCKHRFELFHSITDETVKRCPRCRSKAERVPAGGAGILFKGSGFYITDYRSKSYRERAKQEKPSGGESPGKSPGKSPSKSPGKSPGKSDGGASKGSGTGSGSSSSAASGSGGAGSKPSGGD